MLQVQRPQSENTGREASGQADTRLDYASLGCPSAEWHSVWRGLRPVVGGARANRVSVRFSVVVFPEPLRPSSVTNSPWAAPNVTLSRTRASEVVGQVPAVYLRHSTYA